MAKIKNNNNMHVSYYYYYLSCAHDILFTTKTVFQFNIYFFSTTFAIFLPHAWKPWMALRDSFQQTTAQKLDFI